MSEVQDFDLGTVSYFLNDFCDVSQNKVLVLLFNRLFILVNHEYLTEINDHIMVIQHFLV